MARSPQNHEFLAEISQQLREGLQRRDELARKQGKRYTRIQAAKELEVSRASLQFYLAGVHTPSSDVLRRAMELWGVELTYRGRKLTVLDLQPLNAPPQVKSTPPVQLSLWDSIKILRNDDLSVRVDRKGPRSITLQVEIGFKAS